MGKNSKRKILLFLTEGAIDKITLSLALSNLLKNYDIEFKVIDGDITTDFDTERNNIVNKICKKVKEFCDNVFKPKDFIGIIHLLDMDGAFCDDTMVKTWEPNTLTTLVNPEQLPYYTRSCIYCKKAADIQDRNKRKRNNIKRLLGIKTVWRTIKYVPLFFSCNIEDFLYDNANVPDKEKINYANDFEEKYGHNIDAFIDLFTNNPYVLSGTFKDTWDFIENNNNSLQRFSNFNLFINQAITGVIDMDLLKK